MVNKKFANIVSIFLASQAAFFIYQQVKSPKVILAVLSLLVVSFLLLFRLVNFNTIFRNLIYQNLLLATGVIFLILLIVATGGFFSPFFILIHLATLSLAFLATLDLAMTLLILTLAIVSFETYQYYKEAIVPLDPTLLTVYIFSLIAIVPIAIFIAKQYQFSDKLAKYLFKELFVTKSERSIVLETIDEGVISLDHNLKITSLNLMAQKLIKFSESSLLNRDFFSVFSFQEKDGRKITKDDLPLNNLIKVQSSFKKKSTVMRVTNGITLSIDLTFSSSVDDEGKVRGLIFIFNDQTILFTLSEIQALLQSSFRKHIELDQDEKSKRSTVNIYKLYQILNEKNEQAQTIVDLKKVIKEIYLEKQGSAKKYRIGLNFSEQESQSTPVETSSEKKILTEKTIRPMTLVTNENILKRSLNNLVELAILVATHDSIVTTTCEIAQNYVFISISFASPNIGSVEELFKPFFGNLEKSETLALAGGLEGYLAKLEIQQIGGEITASRNKELIIFTIKLPYNMTN